MTLNIETAIAQIVTHAKTADAATDNPAKDVQRGLPIPPGRCIRVWYAGESDPEHIERWTVGSEHVSERVMVSCFWPIGDGSPTLATVIDKAVVDFHTEFRTLLDGDAQLGGACTDSTLLDGVIDQGQAITGGWWWVLEYTVVLDFAEYARTP